MALFATLPPPSAELKAVLDHFKAAPNFVGEIDEVTYRIQDEYDRSIIQGGSVLGGANRIQTEDIIFNPPWIKKTIGTLYFTPPDRPNPISLFYPAHRINHAGGRTSSSSSGPGAREPGHVPEYSATPTEAKMFVNNTIAEHKRRLDKAWTKLQSEDITLDLIKNLVWDPLGLFVWAGCPEPAREDDPVYTKMTRRASNCVKLCVKLVTQLVRFYRITVGELVVLGHSAGAQFSDADKAAHLRIVADFIHLKLEIFDIFTSSVDQWHLCEPGDNYRDILTAIGAGRG